MVKQIVMPRRLAVAVLIAALAASGCGIKGPLVPPPKVTAETPATKDAAPAAKDVAPAEKKP